MGRKKCELLLDMRRVEGDSEDELAGEQLRVLFSKISTEPPFLPAARDSSDSQDGRQRID